MPKFLRLFLVVLLAVLTIGSLAGMVLWKTAELRLYSVQTTSMQPVMNSGDLAISLRPKTIKNGDIISYKSADNATQIVSHRVVEVFPERGYLISKGDSLGYADPPVPLSSVTGKTVLIVPWAGHLSDFLHKPLGLIGLVYLPALAVVSYEIARLMNRYNYRPYGLR